MAIDVTAETQVDRPAAEVAGYMFDPANDTAWIGGIRTVRVLDDRPVAPGVQVEREARFLGRTLRYVNEVVALEPGRRLEMRSVESPFPMRITYEVEQAPGGGSIARVRVQGGGNRFFALAGPLLPRLVRRSIAGDVERLRAILEG